MTGYHIEIGYNGASYSPKEGEEWETLKQEARNIADNTKAIIAEARRLGAPETCEDGCCTLQMHAEIYAKPFDYVGHPITVIDKKKDRQQIMQLASTGERIKYHVRRAYVRLLIEAMHKHEIEVNLTVA